MSSVRCWDAFKSRWAPWEAQSFTRVNELEEKKKYIQLRSWVGDLKPGATSPDLVSSGSKRLGCALMGYTEELIFEVWHAVASSVPDCRSWLEMAELGEGCKDVNDRSNWRSHFSKSALTPARWDLCIYHLTFFALRGPHVNYHEPIFCLDLKTRGWQTKAHGSNPVPTHTPLPAPLLVNQVLLDGI